MPRALRSRKARRVQEPESDSSDSSDAEFAAPRKTATATRRGRVARGKAGKLPLMPLDVIFEILCHLRSEDLLSLARTSKDFRGLLMSRRSLRYWKIARENVEDLPPCPEDMCEPAYTNLMFRTNCYLCGRTGCQKIYWDCRARYCNSCAKEEMTTLDSPFDLRAAFGEEVAVEYPLCHLPIYLICPLLSEYVQLYWRPSDHRIKLRTVDLEKLEEELDAVAPGDMYNFIQRRSELLQTSRQQIREAAQWYESIRNKRKDDKKDVADERRESIKKKLIELGYEEELEHCYDFSRHPLVAQPKALTDRIWNNIEDTLVEMMDSIRQDRLKRERAATLKERFKTFDEAVHALEPRRRNLPSLRDIALGIPAVRDTIDAPPDAAITAASFDFLATALPAYTTQWRAAARAHLTGVVQDALARAGRKLPARADPLALAVGSVFVCTLCAQPCTYPSILSHTCDARRRPAPDAARDYYAELAVEELRTRQWHARGFACADPSAVGALLNLAGLDWKSATLAQLDAAPARFRCVRHDAEHSVTVRTWFDMLQHCLKDREYDDKYEPAAVPEAQRELARPLEARAQEQSATLYSRRSPWRCLHCPQHALSEQFIWERTNVVKHTQEKHDIAEPKDDEDILFNGNVLDFDSWSGHVTLIDEAIRDKPEGKRFGWRYNLVEGTDAFVKLS